ncbi:MAG: aldo/keto reductase [Acholeplasmataceae bacterium]|nr:MAG: aldo/keto reductase [Acholeplasmataceae bacterium]
MNVVQYAKTDTPVNRLGFGAWQLGNTEFWGHMSVDEGVALVKTAIQRGINFFDTAPGYANGLSETILGMAIKDQREKVVINTKFGHKADGSSDFHPASIRESVLDSLSRLQTDYVDSVVMHNPGFDVLSGQTTHFQMFEQLKDEGLIRAYGVSIDSAEEMDMVLTHLQVDVIEVLFNLFFQAPAKHFKAAASQHISLVVKVPLDSGWLTGKYDEDTIFQGIRSRWDDQTLQRRGKLVRQLKHITGHDNLTPYAMAFILSHPEITAVIPGIKSVKQLDEHIRAAGTPLPDDLKQAFITLYEQELKHDPLPW